MTASTSRSAAVRPLRFLAGRTAPAPPAGSSSGGSGTRGSSSGGMSRGLEAAPPEVLPSHSSSVPGWLFLDLNLHRDKHVGRSHDGKTCVCGCHRVVRMLGACSVWPLSEAHFFGALALTSARLRFSCCLASCPLPFSRPLAPCYMQERCSQWSTDLTPRCEKLRMPGTRPILVKWGTDLYGVLC
jgi:hypothetical protein